MDSAAQRILLEVAREAVVVASGGVAEGPSGARRAASDELRQPRGAFVTLHDRGGALRGCIGTTLAKEPLVEVVAEMARAAALQDPRFPPVRPEEVADLGLEVSVLYPLEPISDLSEVVIGTHGLVAEGRGRRGLLLPQVASERGWDVLTFVRNTCLKAGLPQDAWRQDDVALFRFRSEVFSEEDLLKS